MKHQKNPQLYQRLNALYKLYYEVLRDGNVERVTREFSCLEGDEKRWADDFVSRKEERKKWISIEQIGLIGGVLFVCYLIFA